MRLRYHTRSIGFVTLLTWISPAGLLSPVTVVGAQLLDCVSQPAAHPSQSTTADSSSTFIQDGTTDAQAAAVGCGGGMPPKRGRPRKPREHSPLPKRPRGRPRTFKEPIIGPKRPRGRPRKQSISVVSRETKKIVSKFLININSVLLNIPPQQGLQAPSGSSAAGHTLPSTGLQLAIAEPVRWISH